MAEKIEKLPLVILTGPTAVGKTALSIELAKRCGGEIISADSMQVYRGMDIGTAKIRPEEMEGVPHHLIDVLDPQESFDVVRFQQMCGEAMREIRSRGKLPILVGGTGFYLQAVLYDIDFTQEDSDRSYRTYLEGIAAQGGGDRLYAQLQEADPASAEAIPPGNVKRVIRALEYLEKTGRPISEHNREQREKTAAYNAAYFVLNDDRALIYERIDRRVDRMLADGLVDEVRRLRDAGCRKDMVSMQGIGYRQVMDYLDGLTTCEEMADRIRKETRHFAKRQLTWFRRERDVIWLQRENYARLPEPQVREKLLAEMEEALKQRGIV